MVKIAPRLILSAVVLSPWVSAVPAKAQFGIQLARTYVSAAVGNDANNCDRATPCRTFQAAHGTTLSQGEITVLDPGGYGAVTITKPISIINDGVGEAGILVSGGAAGISINVGVSGAVTLRGLTIKGIGFGGGTGIRVSAVESLAIENCVIRSLTGLASHGILFVPNGPSSLMVSDTIVSDNEDRGILVNKPSGSGPATAIFSRVDVIRNGFGGIGIIANGTERVRAVVTDSILANNGDQGLLAWGLGGLPGASATIIRSVVANNQYGLVSQGVATLRVSQSMVTGNDFSWVVFAGGTLLSYGDNKIDGNGDSNPAPPAVANK